MLAARLEQTLRHKNLADLRVADIMTVDPAVVDPDARVSEAMATMESRSITHLPVVANGKLVGLLSERHVRDALPSILVMNDPRVRRKALEATRVREVALADPEVVEPATSLEHLILVMRRYRAGSMPVLEAGKLVGIVTAGDLVTLLESLVKRAVQGA